MTIIKSINDDLISDRIRDVLISPEITKVKNKLLDGNYHVQSIGEPYNVIEVICELDLAQKLILEDAYVRDEPLTVDIEGVVYSGLLDKKPDISNYIVNRYTKKYVARIAIISKEGTA